MCVCFVFVKDFSGTATPRILKFGTNVGYDLLYCLRENQPPPAYHTLYLFIFLSLQYQSFKYFSASMRASVFKFCIHIESDQVCCSTENQDAEINCYLLFHFSMSHANVIPGQRSKVTELNRKSRDNWQIR